MRHSRPLIRGAVAVDEDPLPGWGKRPPDIIVGVDDGVPGIPVAYFQVDDVASAAVQQVVGIVRAGLESGAHARPQLHWS